MGMDYIGPFTLGAFRFLLGGMAIVPVIIILDRMNKKKIQELLI